MNSMASDPQINGSRKETILVVLPPYQCNPKAIEITRFYVRSMEVPISESLDWWNQGV